jgi:hypothetical protein
MQRLLRMSVIAVIVACMTFALAADASALHRGGRCGGLFARHRHGGGCGSHSGCQSACTSTVGCGTNVCGDAIETGDYNERDTAERNDNGNDSWREESAPAPPEAPRNSEEENRSGASASVETFAPVTESTSDSTSQAEAPREINNEAKNSSENVQGNPQR